MHLIGAWDAERYLDDHCLYGSLFPLPAVAFPCSLVGSESRLFLPLSVTFYYSSIEKTDLRCVSVCTLYPLFYFRVTSNSIPSYSLLFHFRVTSNSIPPRSPLFHFRVTSNFVPPRSSLFSNSIPPCTRQSRARSISSSAATDDIFLVGAIDKVIKPIAEHVR